MMLVWLADGIDSIDKEALASEAPEFATRSVIYIYKISSLKQTYHRDVCDVTKLEVEWQILVVDGNILNVPICHWFVSTIN
jgi:hypothetical protein